MTAVLGIVRSHGGGVRVTSKPGAGTRVEVALPAAVAAGDADEPGGRLRRLLLVDDQPEVRSGLGMLIAAEPGLEVIGEAGDGATGVELARSLRPDVVVMDIRMPGVDGLTATATLAADPDPPAIVILTTFGEDENVYRALRAGARGFVLKQSTGPLLVAAIRAAANGDALLSPEVTLPLMATFAAQDRTDRPAEPITPLSPREEEVLAALADGATNVEIGERLFISLSTVKTHVNALMVKLGARNRVELAIWAHRTGRTT